MIDASTYSTGQKHNINTPFVEDTGGTSGFDRNEDMLDMEEEVAKKMDELASVRVW